MLLIVFCDKNMSTNTEMDVSNNVESQVKFPVLVVLIM